MNTSNLAQPNDFSNVEHHPKSFHVGYYQLHPDVGLNFQMNRFSTGEADMLGEIRKVVPRIHDYTDYTREFLVLSQEALARGETLKGAYYLRSAEFFMFSNDPRKQSSRLQFLQLMRDYFGVKASNQYSIPYQTGALSAYRFTPSHIKGTIVMFGGFDSYIEEWFPMQFFFGEAGFDVVAFEGPGQGATLEDSHLPMTPEWEKPVKIVLDYFHLDEITLMGISLGGCLVIRAAAYEPRVHRVIADDVLTNFFDVTMREQSHTIRTEISMLLNAGAARAANMLLQRAMKKSLVAEWGLNQGMHVTGTKTPYEFLKQTQLYCTDDVSPLLEQDVLLMAGSEDHYVPLQQFYDQIQSLKHVRSLTARLFTRQEQAQNHCHIGNIGVSLRVIIDWIENMQSR
jgi:pimeloyl-ACP methyl ester carboxylesterase